MLNIWQEMFPNVDFTDKIYIEYSDGSAEKIKHLYHDDWVLDEVDWSTVVDCVEV
mgnify:CR=1 FL=1|tara:strand:- start:934 stop:1098 length:165 start_codon:yes stop_codon:yes gene_type:complete